MVLIAAGMAFFISSRFGAADGPPPSSWKLVWSDEFDKPGAPDPDKWNYEVGMLRNHESQYYTDDRRENVRVEDGCLVIEARKEPFTENGKSAAYTSGSINTKGKASWRHARVEVRAKIPAGRGTWPAVWMMGIDREKRGWPGCGEIDIMESVGFEPDVVHQTLHTKANNHINHKQITTVTVVKDLAADFHVYGMEWDEKKLTMSIDGKQTYEFDNPGTGVDAWPFDQPCYLILNYAVGGDWGGLKGIDDSIFPSRYLIDYVRVYAPG
jgi:beta-glucanase (GH16 family)